MQPYTLAIVIPSWNCEEYISEMLDSILANTFKDYRVFVVDDHSTDKTQDILKQYHEKDKRIEFHIRNRDPKGAQTCRNIGLELSKDAKYIIWFDADDFVAPYCFEQRVSYMEKHPDFDFAVFPAKNFVNDIYEYSTALYGHFVPDDSLKAMLQRTLPMVGWTNIYRRSSIDRFTLKWDEKILSLQDSDWNIQALLKGCKFDYAIKDNARVDYFYRAVCNGVSTKIYTEKHLLSHIYYLNKTVLSLTEEKKEEYSIEINSYCRWIAQLMNGYHKYFFLLLRSPWLAGRYLFKIRMTILHIDQFRHTNIIFPHEFWNQYNINITWEKRNKIIADKLYSTRK